MEKLLNLIRKINQYKPILLLILVLGFGLRFYQLGQVPSAMNRDEPAIGYNAYSILKTGKDEWGEKLPLSFKSFGDYKSPLYIYLTVLPVLFFGLTEFSVRFWAALAGSLTVLVVYFLAKKILKDPGKSESCHAESLGLLAAFLLAITPFHIFFSRFSFEAILALFFNILILYLLVINNFSKINWLIILLIIFSLFTYSSSLLIWPLFIFSILVLNFKNFFIKKSKFNFGWKSFWMVLLMLTLGVVLYCQLGLSNQKNKVTIFGDPLTTLNYYQQRGGSQLSSRFLISLLYNKYFYYGKIIAVKYGQNFFPQFLFGGGGNHPWHKIPQMPHLYLVYLPLCLIGLAFFVKYKKINKKNKTFLLVFLFLTPLASAITVDSPHATRSLNLFLFLTLLAAFGLFYLWQKNKLIGGLITLFLLLQTMQYSYWYFVKYKQNPPANILPGIKEAILSLEQLEEKKRVERIIFDNHEDGAYIYLLFYNQYPPAQFRQEVKRYQADSVGLVWAEKFNKYYFVSYPRLDEKYREIYVFNTFSGRSNGLDQRVLNVIENPYNQQRYYLISANF